MRLEYLSLRHFRNYQSVDVDLSRHSYLTFLGDNAQGKTNLLEAIYLLAFLSSYRTTKLTDLIQTGASQASISAKFVNSNQSDFIVNLKIERNGKKSLSVNGHPQQKLSGYIGCVKMVYFSSHDMRMMWGGPQDRRRFLDLLLVQLYPRYYSILKKYNHIVKQRNQLLKNYKQGRLTYVALQEELEIWDLQMCPYAAMIMSQRIGLIRYIKPFVRQIYTDLSASQNELTLDYQSELQLEPESHLNKDELAVLIQTALTDKRKAEIYRGQTLLGPHRDDFIVRLDRQNIQSCSSQGQIRMATMALKIAELKGLSERLGDSPLLLLDDVFSELDLTRQEAFITHLFSSPGQVFLTTTHISEQISTDLWEVNPYFIRVKAGHLEPYETNS